MFPHVSTSPRATRSNGAVWLLLLVGWLHWVPSSQAAVGAVAMPDEYSAEVASAVLSRGGNAVDAAIAAAFVLAVTYPEAGNIGGGGFMLSVMDGQASFLDFREVAPAAASRDMFLDEQGEMLGDASLVGGSSAGVPGTVRGLLMAHSRYGSVPWAQLVQPAIDLARGGFTVDPDLAELARVRLAEVAGRSNFAEYFGGLRAGQLFRQPQLATTLERLAIAPEDFYTGDIAQLIVSANRDSGGLITLEDLAAYEAHWRALVRVQWRDYTVLSAPPPSSGGIALLQMLSMYDQAKSRFGNPEHNSARYIHLLAEVEKRAFADRAEYLGDPDFVQVPVDSLLQEEYLARRAGELNVKAISPVETVQPGLESTDTTHFSILDPAGNAVSLTYTLNWDFGSGDVVAGAGFLMNNEMDDFSAGEGIANIYGVVGGDSNAIAPGKRMLSSMTPTIVLRQGVPVLALGATGGSTIITTVLQVMLNVYEFGMPLQKAVDATRYHHQLPEAYLIRHDHRPIPEATRSGLEQRGYVLSPNSWGDLGDMQAVARGAVGVQAASDNRGRGVAQLVQGPPLQAVEQQQAIQ